MAIKDGLVQHVMVMVLYGFLFKPHMVCNSKKQNVVRVLVTELLHVRPVKDMVFFTQQEVTPHLEEENMIAKDVYVLDIAEKAPLTPIAKIVETLKIGTIVKNNRKIT